MPHAGGNDAIAPLVPPAPGIESPEACENCGKGPVGRFCAACGQRRLTAHDLTTPGFLRESFHELTSFDGRLWRTLWVLVRYPGRLTRDYFDARGSRYMKPLSLFVLLNLVFFIIQPHTGLMRYDLANYMDYDGDVAAKRRDEVNVKRVDLAMAHEQERRSLHHKPKRAAVDSLGIFRARFDDELRDQKKSLLIVSIPLLAVAMIPMFAFWRRRYAEHLVFSLHTYAFFLLFAGVLVTPLFVIVQGTLVFLHAPRSVMDNLQTENTLVAALFVFIGGYIYLALNRMYGGYRIINALRAAAIFVVMQLLIIGYHDILFFTTLASL